MLLRDSKPNESGARSAEPTRAAAETAFSLIELLVVMAIIALLAAVGLPALKGFGKGTAINGAQRQLMDDLALARLKAISGRTTVYVVFVPPGVSRHLPMLILPPERKQLSNLLSGQFTSYALFAERSVGDQPGQAKSRYLTPWKRLPDGMLFATNKFDTNAQSAPNEYFRSFAHREFAFPAAGSSRYLLPYVAFNSHGQLVSGRDELIPLAEGSVFFSTTGQPDVVERPANNHTNNYIRISRMTGRAAVDEFTRPKFK